MDLPEFAIEAKGLVKTYPAHRGAPAMHALKGIDLQIPRGSIDEVALAAVDEGDHAGAETRSILAAMKKSLSVRPLILCVQR